MTTSTRTLVALVLVLQSCVDHDQSDSMGTELLEIPCPRGGLIEAPRPRGVVEVVLRRADLPDPRYDDLSRDTSRCPADTVVPICGLMARADACEAVEFFESVRSGAVGRARLSFVDDHRANEGWPRVLSFSTGPASDR